MVFLREANLMRPKAISNQLRPITRSKLRLFLGTNYFIIKRYFDWHLGNIQFAKTKFEDKLPYVQFHHATPLYRKLKNLDMQFQINKVQNLKLAISKLNNILIRPGETLSFWKAIGRPSRRKGYVEGLVLFCGTLHSGVGGGLCQLSNLIYWMALHTDLTVTERYRHSYDVFPDENRMQPFGSGATCVYNYRDLMIQNNTKHSFQLSLNLTDTELQGDFLSTQKVYYIYEVYEKSHYINHEYWGGYTRNNILYRRKISPDGTIVSDEYLSENHAIMMYAPYLQETSQGKKIR